MEIVLAALVTQLGALALLFAQNRRQEAAVTTLTEKVQTNHGKEPREYLEMIADVREVVEHIAQGQRAVSLEQNALARLVAEHTLQDDRNFSALRDEIAALRFPLNGDAGLH